MLLSFEEFYAELSDPKTDLLLARARDLTSSQDQKSVIKGLSLALAHARELPPDKEKGQILFWVLSEVEKVENVSDRIDLLKTIAYMVAHDVFREQKRDKIWAPDVSRSVWQQGLGALEKIKNLADALPDEAQGAVILYDITQYYELVGEPSCVSGGYPHPYDGKRTDNLFNKFKRQVEALKRQGPSACSDDAFSSLSEAAFLFDDSPRGEDDRNVLVEAATLLASREAFLEKAVILALNLTRMSLPDESFGRRARELLFQCADKLKSPNRLFEKLLFDNSYISEESASCLDSSFFHGCWYVPSDGEEPRLDGRLAVLDYLLRSYDEQEDALLRQRALEKIFLFAKEIPRINDQEFAWGSYIEIEANALGLSHFSQEVDQWLFDALREETSSFKKGKDNAGSLPADLDQKDIDAFVQNATGYLASTQPHHFLLVWEGGKVPFGAFIDDYEITWTQHGIVEGSQEAQTNSLTSADGRTIKIGGNMPIGRSSESLGYYKRLEAFGGESGKRQVMLIGTMRSSMTFSDGFVQKITVRPAKEFKQKGLTPNQDL